MIKSEEIKRALEEINKRDKKRRFVESIDLTIVFKGIDLKKNPSMRISDNLTLPNQFNPPKKICAIGSSGFIDMAKDAGVDGFIQIEELEKMKNNKAALKKIAGEYDHFLGQADMMPRIAKVIGAILGPRGKLPIPIPITASNIGDRVERLRRTVRLRMRNLPVLHLKVGSRDMEADKIEENIKAVMKYLDSKYDGVQKYLRRVYLKATMGKPVKIYG